MCHEATGENYDRPMVEDDLIIISRNYPCIEKDILRDIYRAITDHHYPQPAVMIAICDLIQRAQDGDDGYYMYPTLPFSAMDLDTHDRVQTNSMYAFHTVFESMALAQRNMELLNQVLISQLGVRLVLFCDCGCSVIPSDQDPYGDFYKQINQLRSLAEAVGTKVIRVGDFDSPDWCDRPLDMGQSEMEAYDRMYLLLQNIPYRKLCMKEILCDTSFKDLFVAA